MTNSCRVDWIPLKPMGEDAIVYIAQMSIGQTGSYRQVSDQIAKNELVFSA